jgi:hypothetical protein
MRQTRFPLVDVLSYFCLKFRAPGSAKFLRSSCVPLEEAEGIVSCVYTLKTVGTYDHVVHWAVFGTNRKSGVLEAIGWYVCG